MKTKDNPDTTDGRQNLDEHPVTSICRTVATEHTACLTVLWVLHKQLFILSHLQWVQGIYLKGQSFVRGSCGSVPVAITLSLMLCRGAAGLNLWCHHELPQSILMGTQQSTRNHSIMTSMLLTNVSSWSCPCACNKGTTFTAALILILNAGLERMVSFIPRMLYHQGKITQYPLNKRLGGPWRWSWSFAKETHIEAGIYLLPFQEMRHNSSEIQHIALSPYLLHYPSCQLTCRHNRIYTGRWSSFLPAQADRDSLTWLLIQHPPYNNQEMSHYRQERECMNAWWCISFEYCF